jgi:hypothetical protein
VVDETREALALVKKRDNLHGEMGAREKYLPYNNPPRFASTTTVKTSASGPEAGWACPQTWCLEKKWWPISGPFWNT